MSISREQINFRRTGTPLPLHVGDASREKSDLMTYVCTFGCGQKWGNHYIVIQAYDQETARSMMQEKFGQEWSMMYQADAQHSAEEVAGVKKYNLKMLTSEMIKEDAEKNHNFNPIEGVY